MVGRFTETKQLEQIRKHLMHGRIIFAFTGQSFDIFHYMAHKEAGVIKEYCIPENMKEMSRECSIFFMLDLIDKNLKDDNYHYLLYFGELDFRSSIYDFMKEFYNPVEELPLVVATAAVDSEGTNTCITYPRNIQGNVQEYVDSFNILLMERYLSMELELEEEAVSSIFSYWLEKKHGIFQVVFRSRYEEKIYTDYELRNSVELIIEELTSEMNKLGVQVVA